MIERVLVSKRLFSNWKKGVIMKKLSLVLVLFLGVMLVPVVGHAATGASNHNTEVAYHGGGHHSSDWGGGGWRHGGGDWGGGYGGYYGGYGGIDVYPGYYYDDDSGYGTYPYSYDDDSGY
jgi:hypothetical protein